jgi:hypothetical protein
MEYFVRGISGGLMALIHQETKTGYIVDIEDSEIAMELYGETLQLTNINKEKNTGILRINGKTKTVTCWPTTLEDFKKWPPIPTK